jgi:hypothetical protein
MLHHPRETSPRPHPIQPRIPRWKVQILYSYLQQLQCNSHQVRRHPCCSTTSVRDKWRGNKVDASSPVPEVAEISLEFLLVQYQWAHRANGSSQKSRHSHRWLYQSPQSNSTSSYMSQSFSSQGLQHGIAPSTILRAVRCIFDSPCVRALPPHI